MNARQIKEVHIQAREWFDKANGNSYFSAQVTIYGPKQRYLTTLYLPFQYGYGRHSEDMAWHAIKKELNCFKAYRHSWNAQQKYNFRWFYNKQENCLKRDVISFGQED